jgi:hypothetical protein
MPIEIKNLTIGEVDKDGDVKIEMDDWSNCVSCYVDQYEIKQIIEFLQKQLRDQ